FYVHAPSSVGWVKKDHVVICPLAELKSYLAQAPFVVVTTAKADIFWDAARTQYVDTVRMGAMFPCNVDANSDVVEITIPSVSAERNGIWQKAYIKKDNIHVGFLPYTPRTMIEQAFRLLNAPYGWGGANGEQDCSSFLQEIFATVGIRLPRNSGDQGKVGRSLGTWGAQASDSIKEGALRAFALPGATIVQLNGHVLLYLGTYQNIPYVIHATYGYREKVWYGEILRKVNRVIVSDLSLGAGTKKGSLLNRIVSIRLVDHEK
ncbi:MAG TPA: NlpC/P60 family protein, partial [Candidatus Omnitrophota bacterium]|nr:NlpC/P60 family protein [Candidatus Omnitrophota bacterium]